MLRLFIQYVLPLVLPFLIYIAYVALARGRGGGLLDDLPWPALLTAGCVLLVISLVSWRLMTGAPIDHTYVPPRFEDGRIVPAETIERR
jgi:hypothetical protein